ncbi:glycoside hydrolase [Cohnella sp. CFH 77786]|uniref:glycoside hydrolase family 9 protein n=1 Tax=Cohnella sp. CFH 77786 TaxID=2662265 RepID=UPI001C60FE31|nr:glycoside hydrolase family 9 protein [Cohnella sp. CFH 77786]MBW5445152.1 glycoside hydrolase [Cohnella sp. CFH 77786]
MKRKKLLALAACIAIVFTPVISPSKVAHASIYGAPDGWRNLQDFYIFKDTFSGTADSSGGLETVNGGLPVDTQVTFENLPSLRFNVTTSGGPLKAMQVMAGWANHDIHNYVPNGYLEFNVKGKNGGEQFKIGGDDHVERRTSGVEHTIFKSITDYVTVTTNWQHVKIPLKDIYNNPTFDLDEFNAKSILLDRVNDVPFTVWINQIKLTSPDKEPAFPAIKVNQVGFRNASEKYAYVSGFEDELTADVGTQFQVKRVADNTVAYSGQLVLDKNYDIDSGERVLKAVFSDLKETGDFYITVNAAGINNSPKFKIGDAIYKPLLVDAAKYYYNQRSGIVLSSQYTPFPKDDHINDTIAYFASNPAVTKDVSKGWYDAGDRGKYVSTGSESVRTLLWSYEMFPETYTDNQLNIPESGNGVPDFLDEARWELEWLLKMQDSASGGVYSEVASDGNDSKRVILDKVGNIGNIRATNDTAWAAAVFAQASIDYANYDSVFAANCLAAAKRAWGFLEQNPDNIKGADAYATDSDKATRLMAAASLYRATGEAKYNTYFLNNYSQSKAIFEDSTGDWMGGWHWAFFYYMKSANRDMTAVNWYKDEFTIWSNLKLNRYQNNAWNNTANQGNYYWGSNNIILNTATEALIGSKLLDMNNETIKNMALSSLNYILGANPLRKSFVTGYGDDSLKTVYGILNNYPGSEVLKGVMPLGPNKYNNPGISMFPAKNYMDSATEWTTNEHTVGSTANLVFVTAFAASAQNATNLVANPGFEADGTGTQTPTGWTEWSGTGTNNASYTETNGGAHSGTYHLTHYNGQTGSWNVYTYRTFTGLANGTYTLKAWARRSGNGFVVSQLEAKDFGGSTLSAAILDSPSYQEVTVSNINVTNGQCTIGFWTQVNNGSNWPYVFMDDVSFTKN